MRFSITGFVCGNVQIENNSICYDSIKRQ
jgi:hypothetical protein